MGLFTIVGGKILKKGASEAAKKAAPKVAKKAATPKRGRLTKQQKAAQTRAKKKAPVAKKPAPSKTSASATRAKSTLRGTLAGMTDKQKQERNNLLTKFRQTYGIKRMADLKNMSLKELKDIDARRKPKEIIESRIPTKTPPQPKQMTKEELAAEGRRRGARDDYTGRMQQPQVAEGAYQEGPNTVLPSKIELPEKLKDYSRKELRRLIESGQARIVKTKNGSKVQTTGRFAPPASMISEKMGTGKATKAMINKVTKEVDLTKVPDPRPMRIKKPSFGQRLKQAMRSGEPTTLEEVRKRKKASESLDKAFFVDAKEATKEAGKEIRQRIEMVQKQLQDKKITKTQAKQKIRQIKKSATDIIEQKQGRGKGGFEKSPTSMQRYTSPSARFIPSTGKLFNKGGRIKSNKQMKKSSPRGCGKALRGYGKAMKGK